MAGPPFAVEAHPPPSPAFIPPAEGALTVLSANLRNPFFPPNRERRADTLARLEAFARLVEAQRADVLLCQEVVRARDFRVDNWLAGRLGLGWVYARVNGRVEWIGREEGLAVFSRYPLANPVVLPLTATRRLWRRAALGVSVRAPWGELMVYTTHHSLRPWRNRRQPARLRAWVAATAGEGPALVGGDFNAGEDAPQMAALSSTGVDSWPWIDTFRALHPSADGATHELPLFGRTRWRRLDYVFLRPGLPELRITSCRHVTSPGVPFSDHRAVVARLR